jgi:hypothetical protein
MPRLPTGRSGVRIGRQGLKPSCQVGVAVLTGRRRWHGSATNMWRAHTCVGRFLPEERGIWGHAWAPLRDVSRVCGGGARRPRDGGAARCWRHDAWERALWHAECASSFGQRDFTTFKLKIFKWNLLMVYFGTPNMFITLWFGFDYGTNPPLGTLII